MNRYFLIVVFTLVVLLVVTFVGLPANTAYFGVILFGSLIAFCIIMLLYFVVNLTSLSRDENLKKAIPENDQENDNFELLAEEIILVKRKEGRGKVSLFEGRLKVTPSLAQKKIGAKLRSKGYGMILEEVDHDETRLTILPLKILEPTKASNSNIWLHAILLLATLATTTWAGATHQGVNLIKSPENLGTALLYSLPLMAILLAHELGHYFAARKHRIGVTLPFFIPVPFALGTFGAFIKMNTMAKNRDALFDVAISGPIAGLILAVPALLIGLQYSQIVPHTPEGTIGGLNVGSSILMATLAKFALGESLQAGHGIILNPIAFAGWLGLLVTALNLLPIGQLDGGHISHAIFGPVKAYRISLAAIVALLVLAYFVWPGLLFFAILVIFISGVRDQPPLDDVSLIEGGRRWVGYASLAILLSILVPVPHSIYDVLGLNCPYL